MKVARWLVPLLSLALVLAAVLWIAEERLAPGPLHPAHAAVDGLARSCERCHGGGETAAPAANANASGCTSCHAPIGAQLAARTGLHGALAPDVAAACGACHPDHHGGAVPLLGPVAFARAGVDDVRRYDHRHVADFPLAGAHARAACDRCHPAAFAAEPPRGGGRFLGAARECASCHEDVHRGAFGGACAECHGQERPFAEAPGFAHDAFALAGAHARQPCAICHPEAGERSVAALREAPPGRGPDSVAVRACADCHANPHAPGPRGEPPARAALDGSADCARCHGTETFAGTELPRALHARTGFPLHGPHERLECAACHGADRRSPVWRGAPPAAADCASCHASPHRDAFAPRGSCTECHAGDHARFAAAAVTAAQHERTGFPLAPPHHGVACERCHAPAPATFAARFPGRALADCASCHRDPHGGQFAARWKQCTDCHDRAHFAPPAFDAAAHARTTFPLAGQHEAVACAACHRDVDAGVRRFAGAPRECASCHRDPHRGSFAGLALPPDGAGRGGCACCHDEHGFDRARAAFDHARWAKFALAGAHGRIDCAKCHPRTAPDANGRTFGRAAGAACADCHRDPHAGQFRREHEPRTDCARCHAEVAFAPAAKFDHARDSRFALDDVHRAVPCGRCHVAVAPAGGGAAVVRYRPLGTRCGDCHVPGGGRKGR